MSSESSPEQEILREMKEIESAAGDEKSAKSAIGTWASCASAKSFKQALEYYIQNRSAVDLCVAQDTQDTTQGGDPSMFKPSNGQKLCKAHATILSHLNQSVIYDRWYRYSCEALSRKDTLPTSVRSGKGLVKKREAIEKKWEEMILQASSDASAGTEKAGEVEVEGRGATGDAGDAGEEEAEDPDGTDRTVKARGVDGDDLDAVEVADGRSSMAM